MTSANERPAPDTSDREHYPLCYSLDPPIPGNALCNCGVSSRSEALKQAADAVREGIEMLEEVEYDGGVYYMVSSEAVHELADKIEAGEFLPKESGE